MFNRFGGDVMAQCRDEHNHSALTLAAYKGHVEIVDLLLDNNANIEALTKYKVSSKHPFDRIQKDVIRAIASV